MFLCFSSNNSLKDKSLDHRGLSIMVTKGESDDTKHGRENEKRKK